MLYILRSLKILDLSSFDLSHMAVIAYEGNFALEMVSAMLLCFVVCFFSFGGQNSTFLLYTVQITQQISLQYQYFNTITCVV